MDLKKRKGRPLLKQKTQSSDTHLCWDCVKAADASCPIYEGIIGIIEEYFEETKILFKIPECDFFIPEK